jgi:hypothetical protein
MPEDNKKQEALEMFLSVWGQTMVCADLGPHLSCGEMEALKDMLEANGETEQAKALVESHCCGDSCEEGDWPEHLEIKAQIERGERDDA